MAICKDLGTCFPLSCFFSFVQTLAQSKLKKKRLQRSHMTKNKDFPKSSLEKSVHDKELQPTAGKKSKPQAMKGI